MCTSSGADSFHTVHAPRAQVYKARLSAKGARNTGIDPGLPPPGHSALPMVFRRLSNH